MSRDGRKIVKVDEDKLKRMIAGDDETGDQGIKQEPAPVEMAKKDNTPVENHPERTGATTGKKKQKADYAGTFLRINRPELKRPTTIQLSSENYRKIESLLMLSPGLSMAMVINNILENHFEEYARDVQEVIDTRIKKLTNKQ